MKRRNQELTKAKEFFNSLGVQCYDIVPPINSDIYCVKDVNCQWAAFRIGNVTPVIPFGRYNYMWGYDNGYCLVSVADKDKTTFANKGVVDSDGKEVIKPYTYMNIFAFYGKDTSHIGILTHEGIPMDIPIVLLRLL